MFWRLAFPKEEVAQVDVSVLFRGAEPGKSSALIGPSIHATRLPRHSDPKNVMRLHPSSRYQATRGSEFPASAHSPETDMLPRWLSRALGGSPSSVYLAQHSSSLSLLRRGASRSVGSRYRSQTLPPRLRPRPSRTHLSGFLSSGKQRGRSAVSGTNLLPSSLDLTHSEPRKPGETESRWVWVYHLIRTEILSSRLWLGFRIRQ